MEASDHDEETGLSNSESEGVPSLEKAGESAASAGVPSSELPVFVYGTLKEGVESHAHFCRGATSVLDAWAWGRLYLWAPNIPILEVPDEQVLLRGSAALEDDIAQAATWGGGAAQAPSMHLAQSRGWRRIRGQLIVFPDPERRMRILDAYEGFRPRTTAHYERVLIPSLVEATEWRDEHVRAAWAYVLPAGEDRPEELLPFDDWKPGRQ